MIDDRATRIAELQQEIAELKTDQDGATGRYARMIAQRLPEARAELAALLGNVVAEEISATDQSTVRRQTQSAPAAPVAAQGISASHQAHVHDNTQVVGDVVNHFYGDKVPEKGNELLADYLAGLVRSCQELRLERVQRDAKDGNEQSKAPPLTLNEVFAQLTTDGLPIIAHERRGSVQWLTTVWKRYTRYFYRDGYTPPQAASQHVRLPALSLANQITIHPKHIKEYKEEFEELPNDANGILQIVRPELAIDAIRAHRRLVLLGEPGGGKSTVLRWLAAQLALAAQDKVTSPLAPAEVTPPIPILLPLGQLDRQLADPSANPTEVLLDALARELDGHETRSGLSAHLRPALRRGGVILLLDGLDELPATNGNLSPRARAAMAIRTIEHQLQARIVVTSRIVPYRQPGNWHLTDAQGWTLRTVEPLAFGQVRTFIHSWYTALAQRHELSEDDAERASNDLIGQLESAPHERTREMLRTPLLLTMLTVLHYNGLRAGRELPTARVELYEQCVELLLHRWEPVRTPGMLRKGLLELLNVDERITLLSIRELLHELAFCAHHRASDGSGRGRISRRELTGRLAEFLKSYGIASDGPIDRIERFCGYIAGEVGLLQAEGDNQYVFPHLTFQEYLAACYAAEQLNQPAQRADDRITDPKLLIEDLLRRCWNGPDGERWRVLLLLMAERFAQGGVALLRDQGMPWIEQLAARDPGGETKASDVRRREALLAVLSYNAIGGEAALVRARRSREVVEGQLRSGILDLLAVPDARIPAKDRVLAAQLLNTFEGGDPRPIFPERAGFWCKVPAGSFWFGDDWQGALQQVELPYSFQISRFPVTNALFAQFLEAQGGAYDPQHSCWTEQGRTFLAPGGHPLDKQEERVILPRHWHNPVLNQPNQPVVGVTWYEAAAFCRWLSERERAAGRIDAHDDLRLPTSLEWEHAARGDDQRRYPWGDEESTPEHANYNATQIGAPSPVGCFARGCSPYGLHDMAGNVMEWLSTPYQKDQQVRPEKGFAYDAFTLLSRSSYRNEKEQMSCGSRNYGYPFNRNFIHSFRIVLSQSHIV